MRIPDSLAPLVDYGIVTDVVRPLMSGKEAEVFIVVSAGKYCVAKVYKEAQNRSFKHRAEYTEGRKVRNSRDQRAIANRSKHGKAQDEAAWRSTEVDMIHRLHAAGVRVPTPQAFVDGVLVMELILDAEGNPAPRLADLVFDAAGAQAMYERLLREVIRMLCAGVVHGDLSDFNVLVSAEGPVIIDFPQSVDTAANSNARKLLLRDVDNLHRFLSQFAPHARRFPYAEEMWELFQQNAITPDTRLTGRYRPSERRANTSAVLDLIQDANYDERKRRESLGLRGGPPGGGPPRQDHRPGGHPGGGRGGDSGPRPSSGHPNDGPARAQNRPPYPPRDGQRGGAPQGGGPRGGPRPEPPRREANGGGHSNGHANGHSNGHANGQANGQGGGPRNGQGQGQGRHPSSRDGGPRNGPPQQGRASSQGRPHQGASHSGGGSAPSHGSGGRGPRHDGQRSEPRPVEVIVVRRPVPR